MLAAEISRHAQLDVAANGERLSRAVDAYTMLVSDSRKQLEFLRQGIQDQDDLRAREALESAFESLLRRSNLERRELSGEFVAKDGY
jgi:hypothetical protein